MRESNPHKAIVHIQIQLHEVDKGSCIPIIIPEDLKKYNIPSKVTLCVNGQYRQQCLEKLRKLLDEFDTK